MENKFTLYCRGFPQDCTDQELRAVFSKYGNILKFFKHNSGSYAMIQYDNISSCTNAIHHEHGIPPLKLYVNLARNQPTDRKESTESSPPKANAKYPPRNNQSENVSSYMPKAPSFDQIEPIDKMSSPPQPNNTYNSAGAPTVTLSKPKMFSNTVYKEDIIYMDRHNNILPVLKDFKDELYVPLSCIEGLKRYVKKTPISNGTNIGFNPDDYALLDDTTGQDDDTHSNHSGGRVVQFGENLGDIKIRVDVSGTSQMNTTEPVFDSLVQASRSNASRHSYPNKQHHQQQQTQFGGHTNENRPFNENRRPEAPENRPFYDKFGGNENRPYDNRRPDSIPYDGKRNQSQPFNRNKQFNQDQPRDFNKQFNNEQQPRDFNKQFNNDQPRDFNKQFNNEQQPRDFNKQFNNDQPRDFNKQFNNEQQPRDFHKQFNNDQPRDFNKQFNNEQQPRDFHKQFNNDQPRDFNKQLNNDQPRDFNRPSRNPIFNKQNANDSNSRRSLPQNRKFESKLLEHKPIENNDNWDTPAYESVDSHSSEPRATVADKISNSARRHSINDRLKVQKLGEILYNTTELPKRVFTEVIITSVVNDTEGWVQLNGVSHDSHTEFTNRILNAAINAEPTSAEVGKLCIAAFESFWFRAIVLKTSPKLTVRYIDYGNEREDPVEDVKSLCKELCDVPAYAFRIRLADGTPYIMKEGKTLVVKPFEMDKDVTVVHVENGMYTLPDVAKANNFGLPSKPVDATPVNLLKELQATFLSNIQVGSNGIMEITSHISKETCIAFLIPVDLTKAYADAMEIIPDPTAENISPNIGDIVIAFTEGAWARAYVLIALQKSYKVAFIDYGNIDTVEDVKPLPANWSKLPQFACVCQLAGNNIELLGDMTFITTSISSDCFTVTLNVNSDTINNVVITPWNPHKNYNTTPSATSTPIALSKLRSTEVTSPSAVQSPPSVVQSSPAVQSPPPSASVSVVAKKSTKLTELELHDGDAIRLVYTSENNLYVRTKQAHVILKRIDEYMKQYAVQSQPSANNLVVGQYVAAEFDGGWYRAVISDIKTSIATVLFIDYGNDEEKPISTFKILKDEVRNEPCTLIKVKLRGFTNTNFSPESLKYLQSLSDSNTLFNAKFTSLENGIDMITTKDGVNISDYLFKMVNESPVPNMPTPANIPIPAPVISKQSTFANLTVPGKNDPKIFEVPIQKMPIGKYQVQFLCRGDWNARSVLVCFNNPESIHKIHIELGNSITNYGNNIAPPKSYYPVIEEHVIVKENDKWYRAIDISEPLPNDEFNCFFIDFGMSHAIHASNIRQMPVELAKEPAIANFAYVNSIPDPPDDKLIKRLEELLLVKNIYDVDILDLDDLGFYDVVFPSVLKVLRQEKLI